jgi:malate dehydrogenase (oxaloacetate-decarboxylating)
VLDFRIAIDKKTGEKYLETSLSGKGLLTIPQLNKGIAFSERERQEFGLLGKLPARIETLEEQISRAYQQYESFSDKLQKNIYLNVLQNTNQTLFYGLVKTHLAEMLPTIYTPIVGKRVKEYSREFRQARGLYITYFDKDRIEEILDNRTNPEIDLVVVTDGERVLGIGDQGIGGMDIPVAKLMVYSLCGAIDPNNTLPIFLDVGTNNQSLLDDPFYLGLRQQRIRGQAYDDFIATFVKAVKKKFPKVYLHWEDFGRENANKNLQRFRDEICSFNDDIQGTGVVALAALLAAVKATQSTLIEQRIVIFGAGSAGTGVAAQIQFALRKSDLSVDAAHAKFWLVDIAGLLITDMSLTPEQQLYARKRDEVKNWQVNDPKKISLEETIANVKPTVLIGCSAVFGAFNQAVVETMASHVQHPIIFPLSNPDDKCEANPQDLLTWTDGKAFVAAGSPFPDVQIGEKIYRIAQCNNALSFPGIGLGAISVKAKKVSDDMLWAASQAISESAVLNSVPALLPTIDKVDDVAYRVAIAVANEAKREGLTTTNDKPVDQLLEQHRWQPHYLSYRRKY